MVKPRNSFAAFVLVTLALSAFWQPWNVNAHVERVTQPDAHDDSSDDRGIAALDQAFRDLTSPFTLMAVAARPSDVDEGTLAYCRKNLGARVVIAMVTRGEGTGTPTTTLIDQELGVIRTQETLELARVIGADVVFLNLRDFGPSKSADQALSVWGHDEALRRIVRAIRSIRPDVIVTNHNSSGGDGAGMAVSKLLSEAFGGAAANAPSTDGLDPFQPSRLFQRLSWTSGKISQDIVGIDLTRYDSVRGTTYAEIGLRAHRKLHSFLGDLDRLTPDLEKAYYRIVAAAGSDVILQGEMVATSLFDGLRIGDKVFRSIAPPRAVDRSAAQILGKRDESVETLKEKLIEKRVEGTAEQLHGRYGGDFVKVVRFTQTLERALALLLGFSIDVSISDPRVVSGQRVTARIVVENHSDTVYPVSFRTPAALGQDEPTLTSSQPVDALPGASTIYERSYVVPDKLLVTVPHSEHLREEEYYPIGSTFPGAQPSEPFGQHFIGSVEIGLGQVVVALSALARFDVAPPVDVSTIPFAILKNWSTARDLEFTVKLRNNTTEAIDGALWVVPLAVSDDNYEPLHIAFARADQEISVTLRLRLPILKPPLSPDILLEFRKDKPDRPRIAKKAQRESRPAELLGSTKIKVKNVDFQVASSIRVGFVNGTDSWLPFVLTQLGVQNDEVLPRAISRTVHGSAAYPSQTTMSCTDLTAYDAIVVDQNAFYAWPELLDANRCLLEYARHGGNLIVLKQRPDDFRFLSPGTQFAPFPIALSTNGVTRENASVQVVDKDVLALQKPNPITFKDFEGWSGEIGGNLPRQWSGEYKAPLESGDSGEDQQRGLLLTARYGDGSFTYVSLSLRRQLLSMHPGAYRLLANLVSASSGTEKRPR